MSVIKIKRSGVSGSPSSLEQGEIAYSYLSGTEANGGDRLYIGTGVQTGDNAANIEVIGGVYFTAKLDHTPGTLTANSAVIVDSNSKVDVFNVDNLRLDGNAITSTDTNGNITITPNGSGSIVLDGQNWPQADGSSNQFLKTNGAGQLSWAAIPSGSFDIAGDSGTDTFTTGETLTFSGNSAITTAVSNNQIDIDLDDTAVTPGSYGNTTSIPTFTVDQQGRLTDAGSVSISTDLDVAGDSGTDTISLATETLNVIGLTGITTSANSSGIHIDLDDTAVTPGAYGDANTVATFTVDQQGRLTAAGTTDINHDTLLNFVSDEHVDHSTITISGGDGLSGSGDLTANVEISVNVSGDSTLVANSSGLFVDDSTIDHDALTNFVANEHIDHSSVSISSGNGLTGGGDITSSRTLSVTAGDGVTANSTGVHVEVSGDSTLVANSSGLFVDDSTIDHDALTNFVSNEHVDHSGVSITAGNGLTGGGDITTTRTLTVGAGVGITVNTSDVAVNAGDGITANSSGVHVEVSGDSTLVANSSGLFVDDSTIDHDALTNFVANEHIDHSGVTLTAGNGLSGGGDITASRSFAVVGGTGVTANSTGVHIGQDVSTSANVTFNDGDFQGDLIVEGNLTVNGNTVTTNVTQLDVEDNIIHIASNNAADTVDFGWTGHYIDGTANSNHAGIFRDATDGEFYIFDAYTKDEITGTTIDRADPSFSLARVNADTFIGALEGNANTASALESAVEIELTGDVTGSVSFDGTANVSISTTIAANSIALGTDTTGDYVESIDITAGTGLTISGNSGESAAVNIAGVNATTSTKGVASFNATNFTVSSGAVSIAEVDGGTY